ncbi:TetR/AcrR family transcriptional regulator [Embleya sp. NPDC005575]|uniref:TetR/AcrR family transcriptional regulator n=1 Tax=Embleya sp. NPDC005575 TaxID=3156892 RepID=UPI0033B4B648
MSGDQKSIDSVWTRPRRQREQLSREQIVAEAVRLLDEEGLEALSMRRLGTRLNAGATSLYRHVANKDELIELVVDEVYGELDVPDVSDPANWRSAAGRCAYSLRAMVLRHPWVASLLGQVGLAYLGPNVLRLSERMLAMLDTAGFPAAETHRAMSTVLAYVIGMATAEAAYMSMLVRSGRTEQEWMASLQSSTEQVMAEHPRLLEGQQAHRNRDPEQARDESFDYGLQRVLDGLAVRLG